MKRSGLMPEPPRQRRLLSIALSVFAILLAVELPANATTTSALRTAILSADGPPFVLRVSDGRLSVEAERGDGINEREAIWPTASAKVADSAECSDWLSGSGLDQQGVVFRMTEFGDIMRAVTITRNIYGVNFSAFNFHVWTLTATSTTFELFGQVDLRNFLPPAPAPAVYPLKFCGRLVGTLAQFIVWRPGSPRPPWGSTTQGGSARLPPGAPTAGFTGWYVGHVVRETPTTMTLGPSANSLPLFLPML